MTGSALPIPGPVWGLLPAHPPGARPSTKGLRWGDAPRRARTVSQSVEATVRWAGLDPQDSRVRQQWLRHELNRHGFKSLALAELLGLVAHLAQVHLGLAPYDTQRHAALLLLQGRMVEMATGEGKTLAVALAAAGAGFAGVPVHVVTANDYLAARDAERMRPLFAALGLRCASLAGADDTEARRDKYTADVLYATGRELAFDSLRDAACTGPPASELALRASRLAGERLAQAEGRVQQGHCMAIVDEADSLLLDEANVPLVLSQQRNSTAHRRASLWQALAIARQLVEGQHWRHEVTDTRAPCLSDTGRARVRELSADMGGAWRRPRYRDEAVQLALVALHARQRDLDYLVLDGRVQHVDAVTGRLAPGRVWSRGLQALVELKEGVGLTPETRTLSQTTFPRYFRKYLHLCGLSGTVREARAELRDLFGLSMVVLPRRLPCGLKVLPPSAFETAEARWAALAPRVHALVQAGRPVLVGTDSVEDSERASRALRDAGVAHEVLDARHDHAEAQRVAQAGRAGMVTVATRMAGRGTDIELCETARNVGGLHVIVCQRNPSRRLDRQLVGRAARHGDPGSCETWLVQPFSCGPFQPMTAAWAIARALRVLIGRVTLAGWQRAEERRMRASRRQLLEQEAEWERCLG